MITLELDGPIWSKCSIALTCSARSHFQQTQSKERWGQGWDERYRSSREEEEGGDEEGQEKRKTENRRPILRKLYAALLRLFKMQHSEKMNRSAQSNWDSRESQQPFRPNPNGVGDRTTTLRGLLIGAENFISLYQLKVCSVYLIYLIINPPKIVG